VNLCFIVRTFVNVTMYPQFNNKKKNPVKLLPCIYAHSVI
jgi:hypothetical protein